MVISPQWSLETKSFFSTIRGDSRESNPGPRPPEGRIMPLDHYPVTNGDRDTTSPLITLHCVTLNSTHRHRVIQAWLALDLPEV